MSFRAVVELTGKTATGIEVPEEVVAGLGPHKRPPVRVTTGDDTNRSTAGRMGRRYLLSVSAEVRSGAGVAAGDEVEVVLDDALARSRCRTTSPPSPPPTARAPASTR